MHCPHAFEENTPATLLALIQQYPLATVISHADTGLEVNLLPILLQQRDGQSYLLGRMAKNNAQLQALAQQPAVDAGLCPVQLAVIGRYGGKIAAMGFHLFQHIGHGVIAVSPATYGQRPVLPLKTQLRLIQRTAPRGHRSVTGNPLLRRG